MDKKGPYLIGSTMVRKARTVEVEKTVMVNGMVVNFKEQMTYYEDVSTVEQLYLDAGKVEVFSREGKKLEPAEVRKLLAKPAKVLVSTDGKPIDPRHVERMSEGIALVVSPSLVKPEKKTEAIAAPKVATPEP